MNKIILVLLASLILLTTECFADSIPIGVNLELSGDYSAFGQSAMKGIDLALEQINNSGGINGNTIVLYWKDNQSSADRSKINTEELISQNKVIAIVGPISSLSTIKCSEVTEWLKVPQITPTGSNPKVTKDGNGNIRNYTFMTAFPDPEQGKVMAKFALQSLKAYKAVSVFESTSQYSNSLRQSFESSFVSHGGEMLSTYSYQSNQNDYMDIILQVKSDNPDVIYLSGYYQEAGQFIAQARRLGISVPILGGDGLDDPKLCLYAGIQSLNNTFMAHHYIADNTDPVAKEFQYAFQRKYGQQPDAFAVLGYDAILVLSDALKRAGDRNPESVKNALENVKNVRTVTGPISMKPDHTPEKSIFIIEFKNGVQTYIDRMSN